MSEKTKRECRAALDRAQNIQEAREAAAQVRKEQSKAEKRLKEGWQPEICTGNDPLRRDGVEAIKCALQYDLNNVNFSITRVSRSGKSSLINTIHGLANNDQPEGMIAVAPTSITKTATVIGRYPMSKLDIQACNFVNNRS